MKTLSIYVDENDKEYSLLIGQNQRENDIIIKTSNQNDTWFHLENISGPHFILQNGGDPIPKKYLNHIASMFPVYKSGLHKYTVIYTTLQNVKRTKTLGQVTVTNTKRIKV